ncbi:MAG TPA: hypothetical protein VIE65_07020 [Methylobacter sp.]|jgi:hypothetical protein
MSNTNELNQPGAKIDELDTVQTDIQLIERRRSKLVKVAKVALIGALAALTGAIVYYIKSRYSVPIDAFTDLHVPEMILQSLSDNAVSVSNAANAGDLNSNAQTLLSAISSFLMPLGGAIFVVTLMLSGYKIMIKGDVSSAVPMVMAGVFVIGPIFILKIFIGGESNSSEEKISDKSRVEKLISDKEWGNAITFLNDAHKLTIEQKTYLDGQLHYLEMQPSEGRKGVPGARDLLTQNILELEKTPLNKLTWISPERISVMENAIGKKHNDFIQLYLDQSKQVELHNLSNYARFKSLAQSLGLIAACFGIISLYFRQRVTRIKSLLTMLRADEAIEPIQSE